MIQLRPYQERAVQALRAAYASGKRAPMLVLPTGGGKTVVFTYVAANAVAKGNRVLVLVHREELLNQTSAALSKFGVAHGKIHPRFTPAYWELCQVASVQTLVRRLDKIAPPDLIVVDECHHANAGTWKRILEAFPQARILGVTATPCRSDGKGLGEVFDEMIEGSSISELIELGYLVEPICFAPSRPDLSGVQTRGGDYAAEQLAEAMEKSKITGDAIAHYKRLADGLPAVAFCASVQHAEQVAEDFRAAGYRAESVDGTTDDERRAEILAGLGNGTVDIVASCNLISEGTDIPAIGCAILLRPTKSLSLFIQQVGRALRVCEGKEHAIILDHAGNVLEHGLPDNPRYWSLDGIAKKKKKDEKQIGAKQCPSCFAVHKPQLRICPCCGHQYRAQQSRELEYEDGELERLVSAAEHERKRKRTEIGRANTLAELVAIEKARGYRPGWAKVIWDIRQGRR